MSKSGCKEAYASVRLHRDMVANVDSSEYICRRVGKIIARDLRLVASRLYGMGFTRPWTRHVRLCRYIIPLFRRRPPGLPNPV